MKWFLVPLITSLFVMGVCSQKAIAGGGCTAFENPIADYTEATNKCSLGSVGSFTNNCMVDGEAAATFSIPLSVRQVPDQGWASWSAPPFSESAAPVVGFTNFASMLTINLGGFASQTAGFELEPNNLKSTFPVTAVFRDPDGNPLANVQRDLDGQSGARLFAVVCNEAFISSININIEERAQGFAIAQLRGSNFPATTGAGDAGERSDSSVMYEVPEDATSNATD